MMNSSRECRKAVNRNNAFEGNLRKDLENIEGQRKRIVRSLREKRLNFVHRKSALPKIGFSTLEEKIPVAKSFSLDNADLGKLCERGLLPKKRFSMPNDIEYFKTQNLLLTKPGGEKIPPPSQPTICTDVETFLSQSPRLTRRTQGGSLQSEKKTALDRHRSLPGESSASEIPSWEDDQSGHHTDLEMGLFKTDLRVQQSTFAALGTQLPHSPLLQTQQHSSKCLSPPPDISREQQSVSLPCSPRVFRRRRAESLPQDAELNRGRKEAFAELIRARQNLRTMSLGCEESYKASKEDIEKGKLSPKGPSSPQIRRLREFQPTGVDQSLSTQEDPFHLPRLLNARGSLPVISKDSGADNSRKRINSLITDKTAQDLSLRREALNHRSVLPRPAEKQKISLDVGGEWSTAELPESKTEDNKDGTRPENDDPLLWSSDDDDDSDEDHGTNLHPFAVQNKKKLHSLEDIKHTRYLRMKSPHHWLPKAGNVPKNLLSSCIIVGHTKVLSVDDEDRSCEENEDGELEDETDQFKTMEKAKDGLHEMNKESNCNSHFKENSEVNL